MNEEDDPRKTVKPMFIGSNPSLRPKWGILLFLSCIFSGALAGLLAREEVQKYRDERDQVTISNRGICR